MKPAVGKEKSKLQGVLGIRDNHQFINICLKSFQKLLTDGFFFAFIGTAPVNLIDWTNTS